MKTHSPLATLPIFLLGIWIVYLPLSILFTGYTLQWIYLSYWIFPAIGIASLLIGLTGIFSYQRKTGWIILNVLMAILFAGLPLFFLITFGIPGLSM